MPGNLVVLLWFLLSGFAGLIYQTIWLRELVTIYGSTVYASGAVLAAFMGGLSAGGALGGRYVRTRDRVGFATYGVLEVAIGVTGLLSQAMLPIHEWLMAGWIGFVPMGPEAFAIKGLAALPFMLLPTMAMGATFPVFVRAWNPVLEGAGVRLAAAYSLNTLGAVAGTLSAAFLWIPRLGLTRTLFIAVAVNVGVGLWALGRGRLPPAARAPRAAAAPAEPRARVWPAAVYFLTGFAAIAAEVLWVRVLVLHLGNSVYGYATMLALVLLGIALGSLLVARATDRLGARAWLAGLLAAGTALVLHLHALAAMPGAAAWLRAAVRPVTHTGVIGALALPAFAALALPTLLMGVIFPLGIRILSRTPESLAGRAGGLYAANAAGGIAGALAAPTLLIPALGVNRAMGLLGGLYFVSALLVAVRLLGGRGRAAAVGLAGVLAGVAWLALPARPVLLDASIAKRRGATLVDFLEGETSTVTLTEARGAWFEYRSLETNGVNVAGTTPALLVIQKLQGHLPLLLHPAPRAALHIGFGSGGTAYAVSRHPVERIHVVEISPDVVRMSDRHFRDVNHGVVEDPRVEFIWGDGRNYLLATRERYDVILSDSVHPGYAGNGGLYTREYFELARRRLTEGGVFSMWLPTYWLTHENFRQILKAFAAAFPQMRVWYPHNTVNRFVVVTGHTAPGPLPVRELARRLERPGVAEDLAEIAYTHPLDLIDNLLSGSAELERALEGVEPHHDDRPAVEYESGRQVDPNHGWVQNFAWLVAHRARLDDHLPVATPWPAERQALQARAAGLVVDGHLAYLRCEKARAGALFAEALALFPEQREPWEYVRAGVFERIRPRWCRRRAAARPAAAGGGGLAAAPLP